METGQVERVSAGNLKPPDSGGSSVADSPPDSEFISPDMARRPVPVSRKFSSLQMVFLTVTLSSVLLILLTFFTYLEFSDRQSAIRRIDIKLGEMLDSGTILLADATARQDRERALLVLAPVLGVPDITGVAIVLPDGTEFTAHGEALNDIPPELIRRRDIMHIVDGAPGRIGTLMVGLSHDRIDRELNERVIRYAVLAALILIAIVFSIHQSLRLIVMTPMRRLLRSIRNLQENGMHKPVEWSRNDEFGQLIDAFNRMQLQQQQDQKKLKVALSDAEAADRAKSAFLAIVSHELRTPLNSIIGFSDVLNSSYDNLSAVDRQEYLAHIGGSGRALLNLVNDILDITSAQADRLELKRTRFDPFSVIRDIDDGQSDERVVLDIETNAGSPDTDAETTADLPRIKRALWHLLDNARKATPPDGEIRISASVAGNSISLSVDDTGEGLTPEEYARLSGPFRNGDGKWQNHREGAGLGLTYVHTITRLHQGSFSFQRNDKGGTTATIPAPRKLRDAGAGQFLTKIFFHSLSATEMFSAIFCRQTARVPPFRVR
ncbi:MAG: HAMP domain-containing sensor histidine kinase [Alphaproteobacteria bacterium]